MGIKRLNLNLNDISKDSMLQIMNVLERERETVTSKPAKLRLTHSTTWLKVCIKERMDEGPKGIDLTPSTITRITPPMHKE